MIFEILLVSLAIFAAGIICYKEGAKDGYEQAIDDDIFQWQKWMHRYEELLDKYNEVVK